mgnify:FL=1
MNNIKTDNQDPPDPRKLVAKDPARYIAAMLGKLDMIDKEAFNFCIKQALHSGTQALVEPSAEESGLTHADQTGHLHRCLHILAPGPPHWSCVPGCAIQRAEHAETRCIMLENALRPLGNIGVDNQWHRFDCLARTILPEPDENGCDRWCTAARLALFDKEELQQLEDTK